MRPSADQADLVISQAAGFENGDLGFGQAFEHGDGDGDALSTWSEDDIYDALDDIADDKPHVKQGKLELFRNSRMPGALLWLAYQPSL
jgi:hypothetical protein